jgi:hypothetical protein
MTRRHNKAEDDPAVVLLFRPLYRLLVKFHRETECGRDGLHWAECDALCSAFGWESWDEWVEAATADPPAHRS